MIELSVLEFLQKHAAGRHAERGKIPMGVQHRARAIAKGGLPEHRAYAVSVAQSQKEGRLRPGTMKLTDKGKGWEKKHKGE